MLSCFRSSFLGRHSPPRGGAAHRTPGDREERGRCPQVEARCPPVRDCGQGFTPPYYYWENRVNKIWSVTCLCACLLGLPPVSVEEVFCFCHESAVDFCSRSLDRLLLLLSSWPSASLLPHFSASVLSRTSQENCLLSLFSSFLHMLTHFYSGFHPTVPYGTLCSVWHSLPLLPSSSILVCVVFFNLLLNNQLPQFSGLKWQTFIISHCFWGSGV